MCIRDSDCTVSSCKRSLQSSSDPKALDAYEQFCKADDQCAERYPTSLFGLNTRKRRSPVPSSSSSKPDESHVEADFVHPCFYVDEHVTEYCIDSSKCWTIDQCASLFPEDFPNHSSSEESNELDDIIESFKQVLEDHINEITSTTDSSLDAHNQIMTSIQDNANKVLNAKQSFDTAIDEIIQLINTL